MVKDAVTGRGRGTAFVRFRRWEDAENVLQVAGGKQIKHGVHNEEQGEGEEGAKKHRPSKFVVASRGTAARAGGELTVRCTALRCSNCCT